MRSVMRSGKMAILVAVLLAAAIAGVVTYQQKDWRRLRAEAADLRQQLAAARDSVLTNQAAAAQASAAEQERVRAEREELVRLRGQVAQLRRERDELARKAALGTSGTNRAAATPAPDANAAWVQQMLNASRAQQGAAAGALRGKFIRGETQNITEAEKMLNDALAQKQLNSLERSPAEFADFQAAFVQSVVGLSDEQAKQVHGIVQRTYENAVSRGLDIPSKPTAEGAEAWVDQRHQLDRRATSAVQGILSPEARQIFDRAFIGIMGIDLGTGVDKSNYPPGFLGP